MLPLSRPKKRKASVLQYDQFMTVASELHNGAERNKKLGCVISGMMLQMLDIVKGQEPKNLDDTVDENIDKA